MVFKAEILAGKTGIIKRKDNVKNIPVFKQELDFFVPLILIRIPKPRRLQIQVSLRFKGSNSVFGLLCPYTCEAQQGRMKQAMMDRLSQSIATALRKLMRNKTMMPWSMNVVV